MGYRLDDRIANIYGHTILKERWTITGEQKTRWTIENIQAQKTAQKIMWKLTCLISNPSIIIVVKIDYTNLFIKPFYDSFALLREYN